MRMTVIAATALALAACSGPPMADEEELEEFRPPTVQVRGDVVPRQQRRFDRLDKDQDNYISADELPARQPERVSSLDVDKDGKVSRSELVEGMLKRFDKADANKDGQVTPEERRAVNQGS